MTVPQSILPPVRDQGERYTCLSIALSDGHHLARGCEPALAVEFLHAAATTLAGVGINDAVPVEAATRALSQAGQPAESECPYSGVTRPPGWHPGPPKGEIWRRRSSPVAQSSWDALAALLHRSAIVVLVLKIDDAFFTPVGGCVAKSRGAARASHAVLVVEHRPETLSVLVRNSWGPGWGDSGYALISSEYVQDRCSSIVALEATRA